MKWYVSRQWQIVGGMSLLSALYITATWTAGLSAEQHARDSGAHPVQAVLEAEALVFQATWAFVVGVSILHAAGVLYAMRKRDLHARRGFLISAIFHVTALLSWGIIG